MDVLAGFHDSIFDSINIGLIVVDAQENIVLWNEWMVKHSGVSQKVALGRDLTSVFSRPPTHAFASALKTTMQYGLPAVLSHALHQSPLALFVSDLGENASAQVHQSITISELIHDNAQRFCLIQINDSSAAIKREQILRSHSDTLKRDATTDSLTGIFNRRFFDEHYKIALGQAVRKKLPMSIFMVDVDHFKQYNDHFGHPTGDKVLIQIAAVLKAQISRSSDLLARYGGEEFVLILPDMTQEVGAQFADKLVTSVARLKVKHPKSPVGLHVSISVGYSTYEPEKHQEVSALIDAADIALYKAKEMGRNRSAFKALETLINHRGNFARE